MVTIPAHDPELLWIKARMFINRSMDSGVREFEERAFWASCALELLGKSALARITPLLIIATNNTDDGGTILAAAGVNTTGESLVTVSASTIWSRCEKAFPTFSSRDAKRYSAARNEYLHSSGVAFAKIPQERWWEGYWTLAATLVGHCDHELVSFVGRDRMAAVEAYMVADKEHQQRRLNILLDRARTRLQQHDQGTLPARDALAWEAYASWYAYPHSFPAECPACKGAGRVLGDDIESADVESMFEDEFYVSLQVRSAVFECTRCHLDIDDPQLLALADLPEYFEAEGSEDDLISEPDYLDE